MLRLVNSSNSST